jgi:basic amino acid/polyamine antiporter, APA family
MAKLNRTLGLTECIFFGVGSILGAGIYALIGKVAGHGGNMTWLAFLIASVTALFSAFSYAELSAAFPKAGGEYVFATKAMGKDMGTFLGTMISLNGIVSGATVSLGFAGYFSKLTDVPLIIAALGIIILLFAVNVSGIRQSSAVNILFTIIEIGGLLLVIYSAYNFIGKVNYTELPPEGINGLLMASALSFYAYIGFEDIVKLAEETKKPEKNIPKALFSANIIVAVIYTLIAICAISVIPWNELAKSNSPLADVVGSKLGQAGILIISVIALFSTSNTILANMLSSSRVVLEMSKEISFLKKFSYVSSKRKTPVTALLLILIAMSLFAFIGKIETVALIANLFIFLTFLTVNVSVIILRIRQKDLERPYRIPGNINNIPVISVTGILMTIILMSYTIYGLT